MQNTKSTLFAATTLMIVLPTAFAQLEVGGDMLDNCSRIDDLQKAGNFSEARGAARLCLEGLEQQLEGEVGEYFLMDVAGWKRTSFERSKAMGFSNTSARYEKDGNSATVSLTGGVGGASGLGALAGFATSGLLSSGRQLRVAGLPAAVNPDGTILVTLEDGSILNFESPDFDDADAALAGIGPLVDAFPVADINKALVEGSQ